MNKEFIAKSMDISVVRIKPENLLNRGYQDYVVLGKLVIEPSVTLEMIKKFFVPSKYSGKCNVMKR